MAAFDIYSVIDGLKQRLQFKAFREGPQGPDGVFSAVHVEMIADADGDLFNPDSCKHKLFYDDTGTILLQDMAIDYTTGIVRVKRYDRISNNMVNVSSWEKTNSPEPGILSFNVSTGNPLLVVL